MAAWRTGARASLRARMGTGAHEPLYESCQSGGCSLEREDHLRPLGRVTVPANVFAEASSGRQVRSCCISSTEGRGLTRRRSRVQKTVKVLTSPVSPRLTSADTDTGVHDRVDLCGAAPADRTRAHRQHHVVDRGRAALLDLAQLGTRPGHHRKITKRRDRHVERAGGRPVQERVR